jgi:hypothetical protein
MKLWVKRCVGIWNIYPTINMSVTCSGLHLHKTSAAGDEAVGQALCWGMDSWNIYPTINVCHVFRLASSQNVRCLLVMKLWVKRCVGVWIHGTYTPLLICLSRVPACIFTKRPLLFKMPVQRVGWIWMSSTSAKPLK